MILKMCAICKKPVKYPNQYCPNCYDSYQEIEKENERVRNNRYNQNRDKKYVRFYNSIEWKILRDKKLQDTKYKCERCKELGKNTLGTEVHHIKFIQAEEGWIRRLDYSNLKTVCTKCHNYYHDRFQKKKREWR